MKNPEPFFKAFLMLTIISSTFFFCDSPPCNLDEMYKTEDFLFTIVVDNQTDSIHTGTAVICCSMPEQLYCDGKCTLPFNVESNTIDTLFGATQVVHSGCDGESYGGTAYITALVIPKDSEIIFPDSTKMEVSMAKANNEIYYIVRYRSL